MRFLSDAKFFKRITATCTQTHTQTHQGVLYVIRKTMQCIMMYTHTHTQTQTHTHAHLHTHAHTRTRIRTHCNTHHNIETCTKILHDNHKSTQQIMMHTHTHMLTLTHAHTHTHTCTDTDPHTAIYTVSITQISGCMA